VQTAVGKKKKMQSVNSIRPFSGMRAARPKLRLQARLKRGAYNLDETIPNLVMY
jgi:hypothetical protein